MIKIQFILDEIKDQYLIDERPWIIGFSGGKDSSMVLQLVWYALRQIPKEKLIKPIHVICNDTLVENPKIVEWIDKSLENIKIQASVRLCVLRGSVVDTSCRVVARRPRVSIATRIRSRRQNCRCQRRSPGDTPTRTLF